MIENKLLVFVYTFVLNIRWSRTLDELRTVRLSKIFPLSIVVVRRVAMKHVKLYTNCDLAYSHSMVHGSIVLKYS